MAAAGREVLFAFDRKEAKDHGEGGVFVGGQPAAGMKVVVVDDVITSGLSIRHSISLLRRTESIRNSGVVVAVDREERGRGNRTTLAELELELEVPILPIVTVTELVRYLNERDVAGQRLVDDSRRAAIEAYLERYGAR